MQNLNNVELDQVIGGGDSFAKDAGQFLGGTAGWINAHPFAYLLLGPGIGGIVAAVSGLNAAAR